MTAAKKKRATKVKELTSLDDLQPAETNPRDISEKAREALGASLDRFGDISGIVFNQRSGRLVAGHQRVQALKDAGALIGRTIEGGPANPHLLSRTGETFPIRVVDWDKTTEQAACVAANNPHAQGFFLPDDLDTMLEAIKSSDEELFNALAFDDFKIDFDEEAEEDGPRDDRVATEVAHKEVIPLTAEQEAEIDEADVVVEPITKRGETIEVGRQTIRCADCVEVLSAMSENSLDAIVTDPPYGIGFMGKDWDCSVPGDAFAKEALRVLKPGGHIIAFAATRTVHRLALALEDAGFELRDMIGWLQWQGFPKSLDISKAIDSHLGMTREVVGTIPIPGDQIQDMAGGIWTGQRLGPPISEQAKQWRGFGTALKPAAEPAILARKPLDGTVAENVLAQGVGGLNIDACRIPFGDAAWPGPSDDCSDAWTNPVSTKIGASGYTPGIGDLSAYKPDSRWPANIYYVPKPSPRERDEGTTSTTDPSDVTGRDPESAGQNNPRAGMRGNRPRGNFHPTVKPIKLMRWLVRLVTPPGGLVCDPFLGSGTTLIAAQIEGFRGIGIEREPQYVDIARARIGAVLSVR